MGAYKIIFKNTAAVLTGYYAALKRHALGRTYSLRETQRQLLESQRQITRLEASYKKLKDKEATASKTGRRSNNALLNIFRILRPDLLASEGARARVVTANINVLLRDIELLDQKSASLDFIFNGDTVSDAFIVLAKEMIKSKNTVLTRSLGDSLSARNELPYVGSIILGLLSYNQGLYKLAVYYFAGVPIEIIRSHAYPEYIICGLRSDRQDALEEIQRLASDHRITLQHSCLIRIASAAFALGRYDLASRIIIAQSGRSGGDLPEHDHDRRSLDRLATYTDALTNPRSQFPSSEEPNTRSASNRILALLDYSNADYNNPLSAIGDYLQTLSLIGNLLRLSDVTFHCDPNLFEFVDSMRARVRSDRLVNSEKAELSLITIDRDASRFNVVPPNTWAFVYGRFNNSVFGTNCGIPLHDNINPIFISFHVADTKFLTIQVLDYLKMHEPIGCRDWATVYVLLSHDIDAFFAGCLTTTIDTIFPPGIERVEALDAPVAYVDTTPTQVERRSEHIVLRNDFASSIDDDFATKLRFVLDHLDTLRRRYSRVVSSRLTGYLSCRSLGVDVEFRPTNPADTRFEGLIDLTQEELDEIKHLLLGKLSSVTRQIAVGESSVDIRRNWKDACETDVAKAKSKFHAPLPELDASFDVNSICSQLRDSALYLQKHGDSDKIDTVDIALAFDADIASYVPVLINSIISSTTSQIHFWFLTRGVAEAEILDISNRFPEICITSISCDDVVYKNMSGIIKHTTLSTMDRLLIPSLLPDLSRIIYFDVDIVVCGDINELYQMNLGGYALAARSAVLEATSDGYANVYRPSMRLPSQLAWDLRRTMHSRFPLNFKGLNAGVLVLDLQKMRADEFSPTYIAFAERYGMNDQEVLNCYVGPNRAELPAGWNLFPSQDVIHNAKAIHWVGPVKPWSKRYVSHQDIWWKYSHAIAREQSGLNSSH